MSKKQSAKLKRKPDSNTLIESLIKVAKSKGLPNAVKTLEEFKSILKKR